MRAVIFDLWETLIDWDERAAQRMVGRIGGTPDDLTRFTRALSGGYYFIPAADRLAAIGGDDRTGGPARDS